TVGNDTYNNSFNDADVDVSVAEPGSPTPVAVSATAVDEDAPQAAETPGTQAEASDAAQPAAPEGAPTTPASLPEPADYLETDLTEASGVTYASEAAAVTDDDTTIAAPVEE